MTCVILRLQTSRNTTISKQPQNIVQELDSIVSDVRRKHECRNNRSIHKDLFDDAEHQQQPPYFGPSNVERQGAVSSKGVRAARGVTTTQQRSTTALANQI